MKTISSKAFVNQLLAGALVLVCATGGVGLGTVWLQHQISVSANASKSLERDIEIISRRLAAVTVEVGQEQRWESLLRRNRDWQLGLVMPREDVQVRRVDIDVAARLAGKRNDRMLTDAGLPETRLVLGGGL
jgi:hypothetical protein